MELKVKAQEKMQKIGIYAGTYRYIMLPELYTSLSHIKVIREATLRSALAKASSVTLLIIEYKKIPPAVLSQNQRGDLSLFKERLIKFSYLGY